MSLWWRRKRTCSLPSAGTPTAPLTHQPPRTTTRRLPTFRRIQPTPLLQTSLPSLSGPSQLWVDPQPGPPPVMHPLLQQRHQAVKQFLPLDTKAAPRNSEHLTDRSWTSPPLLLDSPALKPHWTLGALAPQFYDLYYFPGKLIKSAFASCSCSSSEVFQGLQSQIFLCKSLINSMLWQYREWIENLKFSRSHPYASCFMYWIPELNKKRCDITVMFNFHNLSTAYNFRCFDSITKVKAIMILKSTEMWNPQRTQNSLDKSISTFTSKVLFLFFLSNRFFFHK